MTTISQALPSYTETDHQTWRRFYQEFQNHSKLHHGIIHPYYRDHIDVLASFAEGIPNLVDLNLLLAPIGWTAKHVDGYAPGWKIAKMIHEKTIPISSVIRSPDEVFFAHEPDLIHDVFGHIPCLFSPEYRKLLELWANRAAQLPIHEVDRTAFHLNKSIVRAEQDEMHGKHTNRDIETLKEVASSFTSYLAQQPSPLYLADKAYFWIFEFGFIQQDNRPQILGAGLMTSMSEMNKIASGAYDTRQISFNNLMQHSQISEMQDSYLVSDSIDQFKKVIEQIKPREQGFVEEQLYG